MYRTHHIAWIHPGNRRPRVPGVALRASRDGCDFRAGVHTLTVASTVNRRAGLVCAESVWSLLAVTPLS